GREAEVCFFECVLAGGRAPPRAGGAPGAPPPIRPGCRSWGQASSPLLAQQPMRPAAASKLIAPLASSSVGPAAAQRRIRKPERSAMPTATLSKEMLEAHPWPAQMAREVLVRCIDECLACVQSCTACADASVAEDEVADLRK